MTTLVLQVPKAAHFKIVGKGGEVAKALEDSLGVKIKVPPKDSPSLEVVVLGEPSRVEKAHREINSLVGFKVGPDPIATAHYDIPSAAFGAIIGKGGETVKRLQATTGVCIDFPRPDSPSRYVSITGSRACISAAEAEIERLLSQSLKRVTLEEQAASKPKPKKDIVSKPINISLFFPDTNPTDGWNFDVFLDHLSAATKTLDICVFTITDDRIASVIQDAHLTGVRVRIITDNETVSNVGSDIARLRKMGVAVKTDKTQKLMHHKFAVVDSALLLNGSLNWTRSAANDNFENVMITNSREFVTAFQKEFDRMWADKANFQ